MSDPRPNAGTARADAPETAAPRFVAGDRIGRYIVRRFVGKAGGTAEYEAEAPNTDPVALRVVEASAASREALRQFVADMELLTRLPHPDLAPVREAGVHEDLPWVVTESREEAPTILDYSANATRKERLNLFAYVCDAVQHGHNLGILHGDIRPVNVVVKYGRPRVAGFACAPLAADAVPEYASPEQCGAEEKIDVRTDVYSLGVLLFRLLTGQTPYDVAGRPPLEVKNIVREMPAPPTGLPADLDAIVQKALTKDRELRYSSALELAEDVRRFLRNLAVLARSASWFHRARLFARRRPGVAVALTVAFTVLTTAVAVATHAAREAEAARAVARRNAYVATIAAADAALRLGDEDEAARQLAASPEEMHDWEWRHLRVRADGEGPDDVEAGDVRGLAWSPDGKRFVTLGPGGDTQVWEGVDGDEAGRVVAGAPATGAALDESGEAVFVFGRDGQVRLFDLADKEPRRIVYVAAGPLTAFDARGERLFTVADEDGKLRVHGLVAGTKASRPIEVGRSPLSALALHRASAVLATGARDGSVRTWQDRSFKPIAEIGGGGMPVETLAFDGTGKLLAVSADGETVVRDARTLAPLATVPGTAPCFSPDGTRLATVTRDAEIHVREARTGDLRLVLRGHDVAPRHLAFSPDGATLASGGLDGVRLWRTK